MSCQNTTSLHINSKNSTSTAYVQSVHYLSCHHPIRIPHICPCTVRISSCLPYVHSDTTFSVHLQPEHHLSCTECYFYYPCLVSTPSLLPKLNQFFTSSSFKLQDPSLLNKLLLPHSHFGDRAYDCRWFKVPRLAAILHARWLQI